MKTFVSAILGVVLCAAPAVGQVEFWSSMDGTQETPPVSTNGGGWARFTLNPGTGVLNYEIHAFGFGAPVTNAHLHLGAPGVNGPIQAVLIGGPSSWVGATPPLTPVQQADLQAGDWYVNIHTTGNPAGEIRGQVVPSPNTFGAVIDAAQELPPNGSAGTAVANFQLNANGTLDYTITAVGLTGPLTGAHIHAAPFGANGPIDSALNLTGPSTAAGTTAPLSSAQIERLQTLGAYVNLHTGAFPAGEIRGQIVPSGIRYGPSTNPVTQTALLYTTGSPVDLPSINGQFTLHVENGLPLGSFIMLGSLGPGASLLKVEPFMLNPGFLLVNATLPLDPAGELHLPVLTPPIPAGLDLYLQAFVLDTTAPNGQYSASNGLKLPLTKFP